MCGIAGIVGRLDETNRRAIARMNGALVHRGPDADGTWTSAPDGEGWGCLLTHRRLAILDLSPAAAQPMVDPGSGAALVYNGELYNYTELRRELDVAGAHLHSSGDTEVLLRLVVGDTAAALPRLRGMFAFGLWRPDDRTLTLVRDALGMKPLYVLRNPDVRGSWALAFASELRALLGSGLVTERRLDPVAVSSMMWNGFVAGPGTVVRGIEQLPPGSMLTVDRRGRQTRALRYWTPPLAGTSPPIDEEELAVQLRTSTALHLASDVPLGVFLSSGVDSGAVANLAQQASTAKIQTFTLSFDEKTHDESSAARAVAAAIGTEHHDISLSSSDFVEGLDRSVDALDQPTFDGLNSFYMARAVREAGLTVALAGTGGDELFGGYESFRRLPAIARINRTLPPPVRRLGAAARRPNWTAASVRPQTRWAKLPDMLAKGDDLVGLYQLAYALFRPRFQRELLADGIEILADGLPAGLREELDSLVAGRHPLDAVGVLEQRLFLGERLLRDTDAASMAVSLEMRLPLVDRTLIEQVERLPIAARFQPLGRKRALRDAGLAGLDPALFDRPKQGFVLPIEPWLRGQLRDRVADTLLDSPSCERVGLRPEAVARLWAAFQEEAPGLYWTRVWAIYVLLAWTAEHDLSL